MAIYVLEIGGRGVFVFSEDSMEDAQALVEEEYFQADLMCLETNDGQSLWDEKSELVIRRASRDECKKFKEMRDANVDGGLPATDEAGVGFWMLPVGFPEDRKLDGSIGLAVIEGGKK